VRVAFLGSAPFSVPVLHVCAGAHDVVVVVTAPRRAGNRGRPAPEPVADAAAALDIPVLRPERLRRDATDALLAMHLDALVVFAYGQILPRRLLDGVRFGGINVHPSLLPRWRGASPVVAAIWAGDRETGVCIMRMEAGLDTGPVYAREVAAIPDDATTPALSEQLAEIGAGMMVAVLAAIATGTVVATPQSEEGVTYAPLLRREDGRLRWEDVDAAAVDRHLRAMQPWPGTTAPLGGEDVRILSGEPDVHAAIDSPPGTVIAADRGGIVVATKRGAYRVIDVQPPGRRRMDAASYWRGRRVPTAL